jgi:PAS domain S-box-containing protein
MPSSSRNEDDHAFAAAQRAVLEAIALGHPLAQVLQTIVELIEAQSPGMMCSIVLIEDGARIRHIAAPHLPSEYTQAIDGAQIGPQAGSCGTAAYTRKPVIVEDITKHPAWTDYRDLALSHGLRACWSTPIIAPDGQVLATFAIYYRETRRPTAQESEWIEVGTYLAYVALASERARLSQIEQHRMEAEVRHAEKLRAIILDSVDDAIYYLQVEGEGLYRFISVNRAFTRLFGVAETEIAGKMLHELLPNEMRESTLEKYAAAVRTGQRQRWELPMPGRAGEKYGEIVLIPLFDAEGRCTNFVGTVHDLTARVQEYKDREALQSKLHQAQRMQALGTLAGGIAHDFNNIIAAIGGNASLLLDELPKGGNSSKYALEIQKASMRATELVRQILTFSSGAPPAYDVFDATIVTNEALQLLRATLPSGIEVRTSFGSNLPGIRADSTQFHQILINLVTNAAHAYDTGGVVEISLDAVTSSEVEAVCATQIAPGEYLRLRVTDHGCGMNAATLKRVFEPFFTTRPHGEGTGLGLSVVHGIVESHKGVIDIDSELGTGTSVSVYLPAVRDPVVTSAGKTSASGRGEHVMYVDDEESLVILMERALTKRGYRVSGYMDAETALSDFRQRSPQFDVVITDIAMPGMSGPEFAAKLRDIRGDVPIIMTSGYIRAEDRESAKRVGVNQLVYKSNTIEELAEVLAKEIVSMRSR